MEQWSSGFKALIPNPVIPGSKPLDGSKVTSVFHPSEVNQ